MGNPTVTSLAPCWPADVAGGWPRVAPVLAPVLVLPGVAFLALLGRGGGLLLAALLLGRCLDGPAAVRLLQLL